VRTMALADRRRAAVLAWKLIMWCDLLIFGLGVIAASYMLGGTCRLDVSHLPANSSVPANSSGTLHVFVYKHGDCSGPGETSGFAEPYPWAMLMSTICFIYGRTICHLIRWGTLADRPVGWCSDATLCNCCTGVKAILMVVRFFVSQGCPLLLLLFTSLSYDAGLRALTVDLIGSLHGFQWAMIAIPPSILLLLCCACCAMGAGIDFDVTCDGAGDGMLGPGVCLGLGSVIALVIYGVSTFLTTLTSGVLGDATALFRALLLSWPSPLPSVSIGVGFITPLLVPMVLLNFIQLLTIAVSYAGPQLLATMRAAPDEGQQVQLNGGANLTKVTDKI